MSIWRYIRSHKTIVALVSAILAVGTYLLDALRGWNDVKDAREVAVMIYDNFSAIASLSHSAIFPWIVAAISVLGSSGVIYWAAKRDERRADRDTKMVVGILDAAIRDFTEVTKRHDKFIVSLKNHIVAARRMGDLEATKIQFCQRADATIDRLKHRTSWRDSEDADFAHRAIDDVYWSLDEIFRRYPSELKRVRNFGTAELERVKIDTAAELQEKDLVALKRLVLTTDRAKATITRLIEAERAIMAREENGIGQE